MVGRLETTYRAIIAFIRAHPFGLLGGIIATTLGAALWTRRRMKRKFGAATPTFTLHDKLWGESNGSDGHARQSSGKVTSQSKFD
jgi:hypothetical protein